MFDCKPVADWLTFRSVGRQCLCVAIDGPGGSGKSTLAEELAAATGAAIVHGDDLYRVMDPDERAVLSPEEAHRLNFEWERWRDQILQPLSRGVTARYQIYDWERNALADWRRVEARGIILIEGVTSCRAELWDYYDARIYVDTPRELCLIRLRDRGHGWPEEQLQRWAAAEAWYEENVRDMDSFDFICCGQSGRILRRP